MGTSVITHTQTDPFGVPVEYVANFRLTTAAGQQEGFRLSNGTGISALATTTSNALGAISVALENNSNIVPAGSFYVAELLLPSSAGGTVEAGILSSSSVSPQSIYSALINPIPSYVPFSTVPASILSGNNVFTGINQFNGDVSFGSCKPWVGVDAKGAVGNGITDDTQAIQDALDTGCDVFVPDGSYLISSPLLPVSNQRFFMSKGATLLAKTGQVWSDAMIKIDSVSDVVIQGGTLDGQKALNATGRVDGVKVTGTADQVLIDGVRAISMPGQNAAGTNDGDGFYCGGSGANFPTRVTFRDCISRANVRTGLSIVNGNDIKVLGGSYLNTTGTATGLGIDVEPNGVQTCKNIIIANAYIGGNRGGGISLSADVGEPGVITGCHFDENNAASGPWGQITVSCGAGWVITGNSFRPIIDIGTLSGVLLRSTSSRCSVTGNFFRGRGDTNTRTDIGVQIQGGANAHVVTSNVFTHTQGAAIQLDADDGTPGDIRGCSITSNTFQDCATVANVIDILKGAAHEVYGLAFGGNSIYDSRGGTKAVNGVFTDSAQTATWAIGMNAINGPTNPYTGVAAAFV